ncbi:MAG: hypothetical protein KGH71_06440, partial [Candidatus Micrarchaeota archaeon]|nr:hypothetical protein [Candidatus Micrarchaeota archaeon]
MEEKIEHPSSHHAHQEHTNQVHIGHQEHHQKSEEKTALYVVIAAFVIGLALIAMNISQGNYFYAGGVASALVMAVMVYYKNYKA